MRVLFNHRGNFIHTHTQQQTSFFALQIHSIKLNENTQIIPDDFKFSFTVKTFMTQTLLFVATSILPPINCDYEYCVEKSLMRLIKKSRKSLMWMKVHFFSLFFVANQFMERLHVHEALLVVRPK